MEIVAERKIDWKSLLARTSKKTPEPRGVEDNKAIERRIQSGEMVTGLVVSICVQCDSDGLITDRIVNLVRTLAGESDSVYRANNDEFILICPGQPGAAAHRKLAAISRELWDFQLRSLGDLAIVFSWGGAAVENEPMEEAIALATMRMQETRRARTVLMSREIRAVSASPAARPS